MDKMMKAPTIPRIKQIALEFKDTEKRTILETGPFQGIDFIVIRRDHNAPFAFPRWERTAETKRPFLILWRTEEGEVHYTWYRLVIGELFLQSKEFDNQYMPCAAYHVRSYFPKPLDEFDGEQAESILNGQYGNTYTKFLDVHSHEDYIFRTYRDRFDRKRYSDVVFDFEWYFYIKVQEYNKMLACLDTSLRASIYKTEPEDQWLKVYAPHKNYRGYGQKDEAAMIAEQLKGRVQTYEADLDPATRYVTDNRTEVDGDVRKLWYDIETDDSNRGIVIGRDQILSIAAWDNEGKKFYKVSTNEKTLLVWFFALCMDYDVIIGFNSYNFDGDYLKLRAKEPHRIYWAPNYKNVRLGHIDIMKRIIGTFGRHDTENVRSFSLDNLSWVFLKKRKITYEGRVIDLFKGNRKKLKEYNNFDVELTKELDETLGISDLMVAMCVWTGMFPSSLRATTNMSGMSVSRLLDSFILHKAKQMGVHYRTATWEKNPGEKLEGGWVMPTTPGLYEDVYVLDFKSLYASIIWSWRVSPENLVSQKGFRTKEETIKSAAEYKFASGEPYRPEFYKEREAVFPMLIEELMVDRKAFKKQMVQHDSETSEYKKFDIQQKMTKELTNALYGQLGQQGNRYYAIDLAGSITAAGRALLLETKRLCEERGITVFYGDTDSVFITNLGEWEIHDLVKCLNEAIGPYLKREYNIDNSIVEIEYEKRFSKFVQVGGKNYAGLLSELDGKAVDKVMRKGIACVKKSSIELVKKWQKEIVETLLRHNYPASYYIGRLQEIYDEFFETTPKVDDIVIRVAIQKELKDYRVKQAHVRVAEQMIKDEKEFWVGMQIPHIIVNASRKIAVHVDDYAGEFDRMDYWKNRIYSALGQVVKVCFPEVDWDDRFKPRGRGRKKKASPDQECMFDLLSEGTPPPRSKPKSRPKKKTGRFIVKQTKYSDIEAELDRRAEDTTCIGCDAELLKGTGGVCYDCSSNDGFDEYRSGSIHPAKLYNM